MTNTSTTEEGAERLRLVLRRIADKEQVARGLGIQDTESKDEEFWRAQKRAARRRFFQLCMQELGRDEALLLEDIDSDVCDIVADRAELLLARPGFEYAVVRRWFHNRGQFQYNKALKLRHEREYLADTALRVLVVLNGGGAKYLAFGPAPEEVRLVDEAHAHEFTAESMNEVSKPYLAQMATHFEALKKVFDAKDIKVLQGAKFDLSEH